MAGLALRLLFVLRFPTETCDSAIYEELARNWFNAHVYGLFASNGLIPSDIRGPGYPAFLTILYLLFRRGQTVILLAQAALDLCTCFLVGRMAARLAPEAQRRRIGLAGLWLAATCPLLANYTAVPLTEVLATFLTAAALLPLVSACATLDDPEHAIPGSFDKRWFAGGLLAGLGTLVRPETPLLLAALALVIVAVRWRRRVDWGELVRVGLATAVGLALPLVPWAARNWVRLHEIQFLAPRYAESPGEFVPRGLYAWTGTWLERFRDVYLVTWKVDGERVELADIPPATFDSPEERARVSQLVADYNATLAMSPDIDAGFAEMARERTARHPLRTYLHVPLGRMATLWFTPRIELLPVSGQLTPLSREWRYDRADLCVTVLFGALNIFYVGLALAGLARGLGRRPRGRAFVQLHPWLAAFVLLRAPPI